MNRPRVLFGASIGAAGAAIFVLVSRIRGAVMAPWPPAAVPTYDVADYVARGREWAAAYAASDLHGIVSLALEPNAHPAGHPALLGLGFLFSPSANTESSVPFALHVTALLLLPLAFGLLDGRRGLLLGLLAAAATSTAPIERAMVLAPMTEPLAQAVVLVALAALIRALRRPAGWSWLVAGTCIAAASAARYQLGPQLLMAAAAAAIWPHNETWAQRLLRLSALALPLGGIALTVLWLSPDYALGVERFLRNADSGLPTWSGANLRWWLGIPTAVIFGHGIAVFGAAALTLVSLAGVRKWTSEDAALAAFVVVGAVGMFLHPLKVERNVFVLIAPAWILLARTVPRTLGSSSLASAALVASSVLLVQYDREASVVRPEQYYSDDPGLTEASALVERVAAPAKTLVIVGAQRELSDAVLKYAAKRNGSGVEVVVQPEYPPVCSTPLGGTLSDCRPTVVTQYAAAAGTVVAVVEPTSGPAARHHQWSMGMAGDVATFLTSAQYVQRSLELSSRGLRLTVYSQ